MKYTYLLIDFFTISVPFIYSFHPKLNFYKTWKAFFPAVVLTGIIFLLWDVYFTSLGVWGFNPDYLIGLKVANMPLEEILFFFCIPYACVFTFHCLDLFIKKPIPLRVEKILTPVLILICILLSISYRSHIYPAATFLLLAAVLVWSRYVLKIGWLPKFYIIYTILLFPFLIVNGLLTGTGLDAPIVWYDSNQIIGFRILTIPVEDVFYGMALILVNLLLYKHLLSRRFFSKAA
ncbi:lycopene cyclase domain-containing protein [Pedobacter cryoconitis]|uniref:Lycopene cyclase domain-containing protein n=1 Tax=Pedobacter cryoconitis TaxID=188932 RepID=A0A327SYS4_9SPHI|nr:lycopene cyclase domain-containing protein [Pedobacter cryoconitis]RAJ32994.1 lycopene cyclase domain-containing protein [Pedobacter cryoconitis]